MVHGRQDAVVPIAAAHQTKDSLQSLGIEPQYHEYDMGHEIQPVVLEQMQNFVKDVFPNSQ